jgi:hypothetical protein
MGVISGINKEIEYYFKYGAKYILWNNKQKEY